MDASSGNFLLLILISFFTFVTTQSQDNLFFIDQSCSSYDTSAKSVFHLNLNTLLSSLSSNASHSEFYNTTIVGENHTDSVYGVFMCRGDITPQLCQQCVQNATQRQPSDSECYLAKQAVIWYDVCMVRYSNHSFFSTLDTTPPFYLYNPVDADKQKSFMHLMFKAMNETADEAARGGIGEKKYATREAKVSEFHTLYCLAQCTPDLSPLHCRTCLNQAIGDLPSCCQGTIGGRVLYPSCNIRYELYPFYRPNIVPSPKPTPIFVPASNFSKEDSRLSEDPIYLFHNCSDNATFTANSTFQLYLNTLLSDLSSKATSGNKFHKEGVADTVYGLFMCRGDLPSGFCGQCVLNATHRIASACSFRQEAIIWYSHCLLRYSYRYFFSQLQTSPMFSELNITPVSGPTPEQSYFTFELSHALEKLAVGDSSEKYVTLRSKLNAIQTLYTLAQCTQDLSGDDCDKCLEDLIGTAIPWSQLGSVGGRVLYPSCNLRFELFQFYSDHDVGQAPPPRPSHTSLPSSGSTGYGKVPTHMSSGERRKGRLLIIVTIVVFIVISGMLFFFSYYLLKRKARKSHKIILKKNFGDESSTLESLQFKLAMIKAATNNFSNGNRIGKGGFGEVYKGILDGRQIAVKRLSKNSKQGATEFKNEVLLIAKLQHINLVALIGFCLEEEENILIYEYVLNKSLDYFLFDSRQQKLLSWFERYNIIGGIGRGILYLHEDSRLKVIHRDLKPSNVLLDENMIPKISDFGLARIVEMNQDKKSTGKIVGTHGYISPEYAMFGQFSEKSDIFSFGVIILEIITGKHNLSSHKTHNVVEGLFSYVWKQWTNQTPLNILDPNIEENYSKIEVIRCIQIGLLCIQQNPSVRPTIATIVEYLSSHLIELPIPLEPAFLLHDKMGRTTATHESSSNQSNNSTPYSLNVMSLSNISPR